MKSFKLPAILASFVLVAMVSSCDMFGGTDKIAVIATPPATVASVASLLTPAAGLIPIDVFKGLNFATVQDKDATYLTYEETTTTTTTNGVISTEIGHTIYSSEGTDYATYPTLYFDVYFTETQADLMKGTSIVDQESVDEEYGIANDAGGFNSVAVDAEELLIKIGEYQFVIGKTYYWAVVIKTATSNEPLATVTDWFTISPPKATYTDYFGYDLKGWFIEADVSGDYPTTIADIYFSTSKANTTPVVTDVHGTWDGDYTNFRYYLPAGIPEVNTTYYAYAVVKDQQATDDNMKTAGEVARFDAMKSVSVDSAWNFMAGNVQLVSASAREIASVAPVLIFEDLMPDDVDSIIYTLKISSAADMSAVIQTFADADHEGETLSNLAYATTYYAQVTAVGTYDAQGSVLVAERTWTSPIVQFLTPTTALASKVYTFNAGSIFLPVLGTYTAGSFTVGQTYTIVSVGTTSFTTIGAGSNTAGISFVATGAGSGTGTAALVRNYAPSELVSDGSISATGGNGGGASLTLAVDETMYSPFATNVNNKLTNATFTFDISVNNALPSGGIAWSLDFNDVGIGTGAGAGAAPAFDPLLWTPSTATYLATQLTSPLIAAVYHADDPETTTGAADPVYKVYAYSLATGYLVTRTSIATIASINATTAKATFAAPYITITAVVNTAAGTLSVNGINVPMTGTATYSNGSILDDGIDGVYLTAGSPLYVDNVSYTIGTAGYYPSIR